ncbi:hypothetical protein D3C84_859530 [compost metagenome]
MKRLFFVQSRVYLAKIFIRELDDVCKLHHGRESQLAVAGVHQVAPVRVIADQLVFFLHPPGHLNKPVPQWLTGKADTAEVTESSGIQPTCRELVHIKK